MQEITSTKFKIFWGRTPRPPSYSAPRTIIFTSRHCYTPLLKLQLSEIVSSFYTINVILKPTKFM